MTSRDIDIFEENRRSIRDDQVPMTPQVTNEQPMFEMPGVDRVFTQVLTSPEFRSVIRVEDLPPEPGGIQGDIWIPDEKRRHRSSGAVSR